jgi:Flp pilus assembly protein CpaB
VKRRSWLWFIASAMLAVLAGILAIIALRAAAAKQTGETPAEQHMVVVASHPIASGSFIRADSVAVEGRPEIPSGAVVRVQDVLGLMTLRDIVQGEVIRVQDVTGFGVSLTESISPSIGTRNLPVLLGNDKIAVALPADDILSQWGAVQPGDHVDVLFTIDVILETPMNPEDIITNDEGQVLSGLQRDQSLDNVSVLTLQNLEILQILEEPQAEVDQQAQQQQGQQAEAQPRRRALVLKIDPQDAVILKYLRDSVGKIDLALRSPTNNLLFNVEPVNINYLMLRYGIALPQPLE